VTKARTHIVTAFISFELAHMANLY